VACASRGWFVGGLGVNLLLPAGVLLPPFPIYLLSSPNRAVVGGHAAYRI
jgi:hypothetical protein